MNPRFTDLHSRVNQLSLELQEIQREIQMQSAVNGSDSILNTECEKSHANTESSSSKTLAPRKIPQNTNAN